MSDNYGMSDSEWQDAESVEELDNKRWAQQQREERGDSMKVWKPTLTEVEGRTLHPSMQRKSVKEIQAKLDTVVDQLETLKDDFMPSSDLNEYERQLSISAEAYIRAIELKLEEQA